jgi:hypothetical protein
VGIFVGEWAPTFFGLGLALSKYENGSKKRATGRNACQAATGRFAGLSASHSPYG